jgi:transcriptional regulator with XRE-family HTH domain
MTHRQLAAELGVSRETAAAYCAGRAVIPLTVARLVWALECIDLLQHRLARANDRLEALRRRHEAEGLAKVAGELPRAAAE